jgi:hypothetical protein
MRAVSDLLFFVHFVEVASTAHPFKKMASVTMRTFGDRLFISFDLSVAS